MASNVTLVRLRAWRVCSAILNKVTRCGDSLTKMANEVKERVGVGAAAAAISDGRAPAASNAAESAQGATSCARLIACAAGLPSSSEFAA